MTNNGMMDRSSATNNGAEQLPIEAFKAEIMGCDAPYIIVEAETGSGKSTMVPQWYHEQGNSVLVTEPLIETVIGTSEYVAQLMDVPFGTAVGYRTGKSRQDSPDTGILFCTDGLALVRELSGHNRFDVLVLDELHEWNSNQSTLEAWAWKHLQAGDSVFSKIVVLSATMDSDALSQKRGNAPVFTVPGRQFSIVDQPAGRSIEGDIATLVSQGHDVLCFQPGKAEIEATIAVLAREGVNAELIPFHGSLDRAQKNRAYQQCGRPKVVVSTNALETGRTLLPSPGRQLAVVDSGMERRVEVRDGVEGLFLRPIAKAKSMQRRGRTGRVIDGIYVDHAPDDRPDHPVPEILRTRLDKTVLRLAIAGYDATELPFFHDLPEGKVPEAKAALLGLDAIDEAGKVTKIGRAMNRLPIEVHHARMIIEANRLGVTDDVITIVACLESKGLIDRRNPRSWQDYFGCKETESDLLAQLTVFDLLNDHRGRVDYREVGVFGKAHHNAKRMRRRLVDALRNVQGIKFGSTGDRTDILKACCAGMVDHLYRKVSWDTYQNGDNGERELGKESVLYSRSPSPDWLVGQPFDLQIKTRRGGTMTLRLIKQASRVDPTWLAEVAPHLVSTKLERYVFEPDKGHVVCDRVVLFKGQEIQRTQVAAPVCPEASQALADAFATQFLAADEAKQLNTELAELQAKSAGLVRGPLTRDDVAQLYAPRLEGMVSLADVAQADIDLSLPRSSFVSDEDAAYIRRENPDLVEIGDEVCEVEYKYAKTSYYSSTYQQTVTIRVSVATIQDADQAAVEGLIPSGASYTLNLTDEGYTAISGTDVAQLREEIEKRRLELAWQAFTTANPSQRVEVKGLEPLPELPEPTIYDELTGALAFPAIVKDWSSWYQKWYRSQDEATERMATAHEAKARLDAEEDEKRNREAYCATARQELAALRDQFGQINLEAYEAYGLSEAEAGKSYYSSSDSLANQLTEAERLIEGKDSHGYSRTPKPKKALEQLATLRARIDKALAHKAEYDRAQQELAAQVAAGTILLDFQAWRRRGGATNCGDGWVIRPDGSLRDADSNTVPRYKHDGTFTWDRVYQGELALRATKCNSSTPWVCEVAFRPDQLTDAQLERVRQIEEELGVPQGAFGLDPELAARIEARLTAIRAALEVVLNDVPEFDYQQVASDLGVEVGYHDNFRRRPGRTGRFSPVNCDGRDAETIWHAQAANGIVEVVLYNKYGGSNCNFRWYPGDVRQDEAAAAVAAQPDTPMRDAKPAKKAGKQSRITTSGPKGTSSSSDDSGDLSAQLEALKRAMQDRF